ncbi:glycosyltransferase-like protein [Salinarchaeum sp. Harcht-Bsk1]|uniref:glycosyltransferase-like protein n=1 Tax=Salinarchaeum sp. Harcht-Bsk1 TaxID=1333523 RepID=UPI000342493C|nr:glycosyltransferase-like protein [Salinarchaeum sp. Harcht-Bsk1]AGN01793.1 glycosyltransferase-like protein [Salinarchaeum sp. Harcht-Bsk1]
MEYVQERVATLHDFAGHVPDAPLSSTAVVVPVMPREVGRPAAEHTFETLAGHDLECVVVPVRAPAERIDEIRDWLAGFDLQMELLWCNGPAVEELLADAGLAYTGDSAGPDSAPAVGKGADVWLGLGVAADRGEYVVVHDADATSYDAAHVPKLAAPLANAECSFTKGYYARVEEDGLYGRLCRLFYEPLVAALEDLHDEPTGDANGGIVDYLAAFRYALAGEFGATADVVQSMRAQRAWGLEIGTLGEAFRLAGPEGSAQVDLGIHRHDHRSVDGEGGLASMSEQVGAALFRALADRGIEVEYDQLCEAYLAHGDRLVAQYAADAAHNGLPYDREAERDQVRAYVDAIAPPGPDARLPAWTDASIEPADVLDASTRALRSADVLPSR